jgi:hypothetical protein
MGLEIQLFLSMARASDEATQSTSVCGMPG